MTIVQVNRQFCGNVLDVAEMGKDNNKKGTQIGGSDMQKDSTDAKGV